MSDVPDLHVTPAKKGVRQRLSLVWLMPIGALLISLGIFWQSYASRGPLIEIHFENASGIKANETVVKFRDVNVGIVETVTFADKLANVIVGVRLDKEVAPYVDEDAQFWVVRPEVTAQGVSGLDTVLSGSFIEGNWNNTIDGAPTRFDGLPKAPLVRSGQEGTAITLRTSSVSGLGEGTPILYRGIQVGKVANLRLSDDGISVLADGFIRAPENRLLTTATRFWDTSGFSFSFGAQGAQLDVSSLASLVAGGVAFDTLVSGGQAVETGTRFQLYDDEEAARTSLFTDGAEGVQLNLSVVFEGAVSGLTNGAQVQFQGINVGTVSAITGLVDPERFGDNAVRLLVTLELSTNKLGLPPDATEESALEFMSDAVRRGYRAQLQSASLLTGGLKVAILIPDSIGPQPPAQIDMDADPYPMLPSIPSEISDFADTAEGVFNRINELPIEELLGSAINVMDSVNRLLNDESLTETPAEVLALLADVRTFVGSDQLQGLPLQAADMIATLNGGANEFEAILQSVREAQTVQALTDALTSASEASDAVIESVADVPALIASVQEVAASADTLMTTANGLPLEELLNRTSALLTSADSLINDPGMQQLPLQLGQAIQEAQGAVADLRSSALFEQAAATLQTTETAIDNVVAALNPVLEAARGTLAQANTAIDGLPDLIGRIDSLAASADTLLVRANTLPFEELVAQAGAVIVSANTLLNDPGVRQLPLQLTEAIQEAQGAVADLRSSALFEQAAATLQTTETAIADTVAALSPVLEAARGTLAQANTAIDGLPDLIGRIDSLAASADTLLVRANTLPLEELVAQAGAVIVSANTLLNDPGVRQLPLQLTEAIQEAQGAVADLRSSALFEQAAATLETTETAIADTVAALSPVLEAARGTLAQANTAIDGLPDLIARIDGVAASADTLLVTANTLPLDELIAQASAVIVSANALLNDPGTKALPGQLGAAVEEAQGAISDVRASGLITDAGQAISTTESSVRRITDALLPVLDSARAAAESLNAASADLPALVERANAIATQIEELANTAADLPLEELANRASDLVSNANTLIASSDSQAVPAALNGALAQIEAVLLEAREGGLIANANSTLSAAERAASEIARTTADLPALLNRMNRLLAEAETTVSGYRSDGTLGSETKSALRDIREAAKSVSSLARAIERNPNSLLFGR